MNILNGGEHADNSNPGFHVAWNFREALRCGSIRRKKFFWPRITERVIGDEEFAPNLGSNQEPASFLEAVGKAGYKAGKEIFLAA